MLAASLRHRYSGLWLRGRSPSPAAARLCHWPPLDAALAPVASCTRSMASVSGSGGSSTPLPSSPPASPTTSSPPEWDYDAAADVTSSRSPSLKGVFTGTRGVLAGVFSPQSAPPEAAAATSSPLHRPQPAPAAGDGAEKADTPADRRQLDRAAVVNMLSLMRPEAVPIGVAMATLGVTTGISLLFPAAIGRVLDASLGGGSTMQPGMIAAGLLGLFTVQSVFIILRSSTLTVVGERVAARIRRRMFSGLLDQELAFFDRTRTGDLINRLSADTVVIQKALTKNVASGLRSAFMALGGSAMLFYMAPKLAMVSLAIIPPVGIVGRKYGSYMKAKQKEVQKLLGSTMDVAEEVVSSIRTVRSFDMEAHEKRHFNQRVEESFARAREVGIASSYFEGTVHLATNMCLLAVLGYGGSLVADGYLTAGQLTAFLMYSVYVGFNVSEISTVYGELMKAAGASARINEVADRRPALPTTGGITLPSVQGRVCFEDVQFSYPARADTPVLTGLSLTVEPNEIVSVVGASGCGKSTLGSLLSRFYDVDSGRITIDGVDIRELDPHFLRRIIGSVAQEPTLFAATIRKNIRYGNPDATPQEVEAAAVDANAMSFIRHFPDGLDTLVGERGVQLSGGQKQRIAIARLLLKNPAIVILDEATSSLDAESEHAVQEALARAVDGRTVINIAHRLSTMKMADTMAAMANGRVVERGEFDDLVAAGGVFADLTQRQMS